MSTNLEQPITRQPSERVADNPEAQRVRAYLHRPASPAEAAARKAAVARLDTLMRELGDAAITDEDVAAYLAELDAPAPARR